MNSQEKETRKFNETTRLAAERFYDGFWGILVKWFKVPQTPPTLVTHDGTEPMAFKPARGYLDYMKFLFWLWLCIVDIAIAVVWIIITVASPLLGMLLLIPALFLMFAPDMVAYLAIHLKYDTTWYVMTDRSIRIRRGIWVISEMTLTFENIQNVTVQQGPLQRHFGISDICIETAGGGSGQENGQAGSALHQGRIEGIKNAHEIRDLIMSRLRQSQSAGLGDDHFHGQRGIDRGTMWSPAHISVLKEIRDLVVSNH